MSRESNAASCQEAPRPAILRTVPSFREVYDTHFSFVWRAVANRGVPHSALDDVVQEVFLVVHRKLPEFEGRSSLRTWLAGIVRRAAADHLKKRGNQLLARDELDDYPADRDEPSVVVEKRAAIQLVEELLSKMSEAQREVFVLYELEQIPMAQVAEIVGCPLQTAYSRLHAARATVEATAARLRAKEQS